MSQMKNISDFSKQIRSFYDNPSINEYISALSIYTDIKPSLTQHEIDDVHLQLKTIYRYLIESEKQEKQSKLNSDSEEEDPDQSAGKKRIKSKKYRKTKSRKMSKKSRKMKHKSRRH